jgi:hypothetical protein
MSEMSFDFTVSVTVRKVSGPFVSREHMSEQLQEELDGANPQALYSDSEYEVTDWQVTENERPAKNSH